MNKSSLLRLSRAFGRGQLTKETYRRRRAELIAARLRQDEDEETVTDHRDRHYPAADSVTATDRRMPDIKSRLTRSRPALVAGMVGVIAVGAGLMILMSGEEEPPREPEAATMPQRTVSREPVDVLGSYTDEILADETLTDDEIINLVDLWDVSTERTQQQWLENAEKRLIQARETDDETRIRLLENIYYELDVPVPTSGSAAARVAAADVTKSDEGQMATTEPAGESAAEESDVAADETSVAAADTDPATARPRAESDEASAEFDQTEPGIEQTDAGTEETASAEESADEAPAIAQKTDDREAAAPEAGPESDSVQPEPEPGTGESAVQESIAEASTVAANQRQDLQQPARPQDQQEETGQSRLAGVEPSEEMLQQQEREMTRSGIDLHAALGALSETELTLERLSDFTNTWAQATRDEKLAFAITGDKNLFESVKSIARSEHSRYQYAELERDERHTKLRRLNDILGGVIKYRESQQSGGLAAITDSGRLEKSDLMRLNGDKYTLQLVGAESEEGVQDYIRRHARLGNLFYVEVPKDDASWYVVLQGEYSNKNLALLVYDDFPEDLKGERPWARSFKSLQELFE